MARGKGVRMQRYKDGGVSDAKAFAMNEGLSWTDSSGRVFNVASEELKDWLGHRAEPDACRRGIPQEQQFG